MLSTLHRIATSTGAHCATEVPGLVPGTSRRPADLLVSGFTAATHNLAIDVAVQRLQTTSKQRQAALRPGRPVELKEKEKIRLFAERCGAPQGLQFWPFIVDEYGHIGGYGQVVLEECARRVALRGSFVLGKKASQRRAALLRRWRGEIAVAVHLSIFEVVEQRVRLTLAAVSRRHS